MSPKPLRPHLLDSTCLLFYIMCPIVPILSWIPTALLLLCCLHRSHLSFISSPFHTTSLPYRLSPILVYWTLLCLIMIGFTFWHYSHLPCWVCRFPYRILSGILCFMHDEYACTILLELLLSLESHIVLFPGPAYSSITVLAFTLYP